MPLAPVTCKRPALSPSHTRTVSLERAGDIALSIVPLAELASTIVTKLPRVEGGSTPRFEGRRSDLDTATYARHPTRLSPVEQTQQFFRRLRIGTGEITVYPGFEVDWRPTTDGKAFLWLDYPNDGRYISSSTTTPTTSPSFPAQPPNFSTAWPITSRYSPSDDAGNARPIGANDVRTPMSLHVEPRSNGPPARAESAWVNCRAVAAYPFATSARVANACSQSSATRAAWCSVNREVLQRKLVVRAGPSGVVPMPAMTSIA